MSTIDEIRKKVDELTAKTFDAGYEAGYKKGFSGITEFLEWLNSEVAIIGKDQDGKTHILVARRVQEDPKRLVWVDAVREFNLRNQQPEELTPVNEITFEGTMEKSKIKLNHPSDQMEEEVSE